MNERNNFTRFLIVVLILFLLTLVAFSFFHFEPKGVFSGTMITIIAFIVILSLSEVFDSFSVGKIFSLQRTVKEKEKKIENTETEISTVKRENIELRNQIINISQSFNQNQSTNNFFGLSENTLKALTVKQAEPEEIEESQKNESQEKSDEQQKQPRSIDRRKAEKFVIDQVIKKYKLSDFTLIEDAKLVSTFYGIDPISETNPIYDGYVKTLDAEIFIEVRPERMFHPMFRDRLYVMLSKIHHYKTIKKTNAFLLLATYKVDGEDNDRRNHYDRFINDFEPARNNNLLKIEPILIEKESLEDLYE